MSLYVYAGTRKCKAYRIGIVSESFNKNELYFLKHFGRELETYVPFRG
jgi:hypothetical protein